MELLAVIASDADENIAERAAGTLLTQPQEGFLAALARPDAAPELFTYCAGNLAQKPGIADALAKNAACPAALLTQLAEQLTSAGVQALLDNLERLTSSPDLVIALAGCPSVSAEQRELIQEMQKGAVDAAEAAQMAEALAADEPDPVRRLTLSQQLAKLNVVQRIIAALKGGRQERMFLIRDPNKVVQRAVMQAPRLTETEVESFAAMTILPGEILRLIAFNRKFIKNYPIVRNLVSNPKTPLDVSLHLLPRLTPQDVRVLTTNRNIPDNLRSMATKLQRQRSILGQGR